MSKVGRELCSGNEREQERRNLRELGRLKQSDGMIPPKGSFHEISLFNGSACWNSFVVAWVVRGNS